MFDPINISDYKLERIKPGSGTRTSRADCYMIGERGREYAFGVKEEDSRDSSSSQLFSLLQQLSSAFYFVPASSSISPRIYDLKSSSY
ncbi:unnamed protein product [Brassica rapa]|uniref:Uncharacterized protein n=1 Tax=Brassica campestris TaxID=3711 RepID=A0A8D9MBF4_BRACM|nr:unnamed protein product [Brassica rapa]